MASDSPCDLRAWGISNFGVGHGESSLRLRGALLDRERPRSLLPYARPNLRIVYFAARTTTARGKILESVVCTEFILPGT